LAGARAKAPVEKRMRPKKPSDRARMTAQAHLIDRIQAQLSVFAARKGMPDVLNIVKYIV
jgi:hypothetical protein